MRPAVDGEDPETVFTELVRSLLRPADTVLDIGTGTGEWLMENVSPVVASCIVIDYALLRLRQRQPGRASESPGRRALVLADARRLPLPDASVSVIINRRGPLTADDRFFREGVRVLRAGGLVLEITIGERNAQEMVESFGRGQMMEEAANGPRLPRLLNWYRSLGLEPFATRDVAADEFFPDVAALEHRLTTTPTIDDYDPIGDRAHLADLVSRQTTDRGIRLTLHRLIIAARKMA
jgi:SAM-dependent methyltransferase